MDCRRDASKHLIWLITSVNESCGHAHLGVLFVELEVVGLLLEKSDFLGVACVPLRGGTGGFSGRGGDRVGLRHLLGACLAGLG